MNSPVTISTPKIFLVDAEPYYLHLYGKLIRNLGYTKIYPIQTCTDLMNQLALRPDIVFLDYNMDNLNGIKILRKIKRFDPNIVVFFVTGQEVISMAMDAVTQGAFDFIIKQNVSQERFKYCFNKVKLRGLSARDKCGIAPKILEKA